MDLLETPDKDLPLRDDIRLLGRILGDTVRGQEGEPVFAIVEHIRRNSIRFHREEDAGVARKFIRQADENNQLLAEVILPAQREQILAEAKAWAAQNEAVDPAEKADESGQKIAITSYEGSKGRSAQYVFLIGVHSGELPKNAAAIDDIEICRFLVGLTRTRKRCSILVANNAMGRFKNRSEFIAWINSARLREKKISAAYWT
jgi:superfamily I DNA/RNA helicase